MWERRGKGEGTSEARDVGSPVAIPGALCKVRWRWWLLPPTRPRLVVYPNRRLLLLLLLRVGNAFRGAFFVQILVFFCFAMSPCFYLFGTSPGEYNALISIITEFSVLWIFLW